MTEMPEGFEQNYPLLEHLVLHHITSSSFRTPLSSILGHSRVLLEEISGPINKQQRADLESIHYAAEQLWEHLTVFLDAVPLIFGKRELYVKDIDLLQLISDVVSQIQEKTKFQIEQHIPISLPPIRADEGEIYKALYSIVGLVKQIHPTHEGKISFSVQDSEKFVTVSVSTEKEEVLQMDTNPELFIAQTIARLHSGKLQIESDDNNRLFINLILPYQL